MKKVFLSLLFVLAAASATFAARQPGTRKPRVGARGSHVTITRDDWGIAHVYGKTDADAVFGMIYAQAEDDFNRVETITSTRWGGFRRPKAKQRFIRICE